jgi:protein-L-isoaspartate(D-aspartate) O-methyltransferase
MERQQTMKSGEFKNARQAMVASQLRPNAVTDVRVLDAMGRIRREDYVPESYRVTAYADTIIPTGDGRAVNSPMVIGRLLNEARIAAGDRVLIVGSATGYMAAVAGCLTDSVSITAADVGGVEGPYDVIVIDGAVEQISDALIAALSPAGRLVTGIVDGGVTRLAVGRKGGSGFGLIPFADTEMVVLPEFSRPRVFAF